MIYCPKCGTANRDGSRFCNECGQKLGGPTRVKCARCGAMNPVQSAFCSECGGQLLSSSEGLGAEAAPTIKGLSLPTKGPAGQGEPPEAKPAGQEEVPTWLRELGAARAAEAGGTSEQEDAAEVPDWLQDLRDSFPIEEEEQAPAAMEGQEDVPDWLARIRPVDGAETDGQPAVPQSDGEDIPDWLAELRPLTVEAAAGPEPAEEDEGLPDWLAELRPAARAEAPEPEAAEPEDEEEVPDWLAQLRPAAQAKAPEPAEPEAAEPEGEEEVPDWLAQLRPAAQAEASEPEPAELEAEEEKVPDWLAQLRPAAQAQASEPEPAELEAEEEETPDWLAELRPAAQAQAPEPEPEGEEEETPDWLAELRPAAQAQASEPEPAEPEGEEEEAPDWLAELRPAGRAEASEPEEEEAPDWLAELRPAGMAEAPEAEEEQVPEPEPAMAEESEGSSEAEAELPDWLAELRATDAAGPEPPTGWQDEEAAEEPAEPAPMPEAEEAELPDWLATMRPEPEGGEAAPGWLVEVPSGKEEIAPAAMPDWLHDLEPAGLEEEASPPGQEEAGEGELPAWLVPSSRGSEEESLARAEIPDWLLALKPAELREKGEPETPSPLVVEPVEETGLLAGLRGTLPVEMLIAQPRAVAAAEPSPAIHDDTPQARLFAQIVGRGPEAVPKPVPQPRQSLLSRLPLWLTYLALLAAVTLPLLLQNPLIERTIEAPARVLDLYDTIEALEAGGPVLVAFDYDPSTSEEMNVLARTVVGHLMDRGVPVVAMSLQSAGPPVAQSILEELAAERPGARFANVGLLTGQAAGVQVLGQGLTPALGQAFQGAAPADEELLSGITGLDSFELLLVLAAEPDSLRIWVEQASALQGAPLAAAVSASTEPQARSYYETDPRQLLGLVAGVPGAATYEALRTGDGTVPPEMAARLDSHLAGHAVFVLVLVVGNVAYFVRRGSRGRR